MTQGRTIALYGDTDSGKTTQIGQLAKDTWKRKGLKTWLNFTDQGGYESIKPMEKAGFLTVNPIKQGQDPWLYINDAVRGDYLTPEYGLVANDSAASQSERLLDWITKDPRQIGQQKTQRFTVTVGDRSLAVGANNESHYGLVQSFMRDALWQSTYLIDKGIDVVWTFGLHRGEAADGSLRLGPLLCGKALTPILPKWFRYVWPLVTLTPAPGQTPKHALFLAEQPDPLGSGGMYFANSRYPLEAQTPLPAVLEPASVVEALRLIELGHAEAEKALLESN